MSLSPLCCLKMPELHPLPPCYNLFVVVKPVKFSPLNA